VGAVATIRQGFSPPATQGSSQEACGQAYDNFETRAFGANNEFWVIPDSQMFAMKEKNAMECDASIYVSRDLYLQFSRIIVVFCRCHRSVLLPSRRSPKSATCHGNGGGAVCR
jgi:hypothetical protein